MLNPTGEMETITLNNGVEMPALGPGVFQTPPDETRDAVQAALGSGHRHIDTAAAYGFPRARLRTLSRADLAPRANLVAGVVLSRLRFPNRWLDRLRLER